MFIIELLLYLSIETTIMFVYAFFNQFFLEIILVEKLFDVTFWTRVDSFNEIVIIGLWQSLLKLFFIARAQLFAMFENVHILNLLNHHVTTTSELNVVHLNWHIVAQWISLEVRSKREVRCHFLNGRQLLRFICHNIHVKSRKISIECEHLNDRNDWEEQQEPDECSLQFDVSVDTETKSVKGIMNAVAILINLLLRSHEHMRPVFVELIGLQEPFFDLSAIFLHRFTLPMLACETIDQVRVNQFSRHLLQWMLQLYQIINHSQITGINFHPVSIILIVKAALLLLLFSTSFVMGHEIIII